MKQSSMVGGVQFGIHKSIEIGRYKSINLICKVNMCKPIA